MSFFDRFFGPPGKDKFARMLMDAIRKAGETDPIHYDAKHYRLHREGEGKTLLNLTNVYHEYCAAPKDRRQVIVRNFVRTWFIDRRETPEAFEDVRPDLLLSVRNRAYYELTGLRIKMTEGAKFDWPYRVLADSLGIGLVYDLRESMMQVQQHHLDDWRTTFDEAYEVAYQNLMERSLHAWNPAGPGVWVSPWQDNYDPSRMLLTELLRQHGVAGDPVVMVPNRDTLLLAGTDDENGLTQLVTLAEKAYDQPRSISGLAFRLTPEDDWVPFLPDEAHPAYRQFNWLRVRTHGGDYEDQTADLNALHEKKGKDVFVATYSAVKKAETGEVRSYCVWSDGVVAMLPRTDDIYFVRPKGEEDIDVVASVPWKQAEAVLGDMLKPVGLYPERYLTDGFPSEEQLALFGSLSRPTP